MTPAQEADIPETRFSHVADAISALTVTKNICARTPGSRNGSVAKIGANPQKTGAIS